MDQPFGSVMSLPESFVIFMEAAGQAAVLAIDITNSIVRSRVLKKKILESCATPNWSKGSVGQKEFRYQIPSFRSQIPNSES